jgi:hypothetical protein
VGNVGSSSFQQLRPSGAPQHGPRRIATCRSAGSTRVIGKPSWLRKSAKVAKGICPDIFVAKYDRDGALVWAKRTAQGIGIATTPRGESYVTGSFGQSFYPPFGGTATFGLDEPNQTTLLSPGGSAEIFVAKFR